MSNMTRPSMRWSLIMALTLSQCVCQNNRPSESETIQPVDGAARPTRASGPGAADAGPATAPKPADAPKLPATIDTKDLDDSEKALLAEVLTEQYDPCGKQRSFLASLADPATCDTAKRLGELAVTKVSYGLSKKQIVKELLQEQARWAKKAEFDLDGVPVYGQAGAGKRVIVEFSDFQCPHCKLASKPAKELAKKYGAVLYAKQLPLEHHPLAKDAALMALAAHRQGKFWEVSALFFEHQDTLSPERLRELVREAGVDLARFDKDLADPAIAKTLERDLAEANRLEVGGTPTFYVDGFEVPYEQLEATLQAPPKE